MRILPSCVRVMFLKQGWQRTLWHIHHFYHVMAQRLSSRGRSKMVSHYKQRTDLTKLQTCRHHAPDFQPCVVLYKLYSLMYFQIVARTAHIFTDNNVCCFKYYFRWFFLKKVSTLCISVTSENAIGITGKGELFSSAYLSKIDSCLETEFIAFINTWWTKLVFYRLRLLKFD